MCGVLLAALTFAAADPPAGAEPDPWAGTGPDPWADRAPPGLSIDAPGPGSAVGTWGQLPVIVSVRPAVASHLLVEVLRPRPGGGTERVAAVRARPDGEFLSLNLAPPDAGGWGGPGALVIAVRVRELPQVRGQRRVTVRPGGPPPPGPRALPSEEAAGVLIDADAAARAPGRRAGAVPAGELFRVRGTFFASDADARTGAGGGPPPAILTLLNADGVAVASVTSPTFRDAPAAPGPPLDGETLWYETALTAPTRPGTYTLEAVASARRRGDPPRLLGPLLVVTVTESPAE